jgi:hypothetical protein
MLHVLSSLSAARTRPSPSRCRRTPSRRRMLKDQHTYTQLREKRGEGGVQSRLRTLDPSLRSEASLCPTPVLQALTPRSRASERVLGPKTRRVRASPQLGSPFSRLPSCALGPSFTATSEVSRKTRASTERESEQRLPVRCLPTTRSRPRLRPKSRRLRTASPTS